MQERPLFGNIFNIGQNFVNNFWQPRSLRLLAILPTLSFFSGTFSPFPISLQPSCFGVFQHFLCFSVLEALCLFSFGFDQLLFYYSRFSVYPCSRSSCTCVFSLVDPFSFPDVYPFGVFTSFATVNMTSFWIQKRRPMWPNFQVTCICRTIQLGSNGFGLESSTLNLFIAGLPGKWVSFSG